MQRIDLRDNQIFLAIWTPITLCRQIGYPTSQNIIRRPSEKGTSTAVREPNRPLLVTAKNTRSLLRQVRDDAAKMQFQEAEITGHIRSFQGPNMQFA